MHELLTLTPAQLQLKFVCQCRVVCRDCGITGDNICNEEAIEPFDALPNSIGLFEGICEACNPSCATLSVYCIQPEPDACGRMCGGSLLGSRERGMGFRELDCWPMALGVCDFCAPEWTEEDFADHSGAGGAESLARRLVDHMITLVIAAADSGDAPHWSGLSHTRYRPGSMPLQYLRWV